MRAEPEVKKVPADDAPLERYLFLAPSAGVICLF